INSAVFLKNRTEHSFMIRERRHIALQRKKFSAGFFNALFYFKDAADCIACIKVSRISCEVPAFFCEFDCDAATDPTARAGDKCNGLCHVTIFLRALLICFNCTPESLFLYALSSG